MAVTSAEITSRTPFENGNSWGKVGAYERIDGMINFEVSSEQVQNRFLDRVQLCKPWVSLGDAQSLVMAENLGGLLSGGHDRIRMSVGLEAVEDIIADLDQALV